MIGAYLSLYNIRLYYTDDAYGAYVQILFFAFAF